MNKEKRKKPAEALLTIAEAAKYLNVSYRQMFRFIEAGELRPLRLTERIVRIRPDDLGDFLSRKQGAV
ncbi:MAG: helix-turn-helix domain-containing protein [Chloroflexales bacterium]|jgi:excisionase family DNA binding protein